MKTIKSTLLIVLGLALYSCDDDKKEEVATPEEAKASMNQMAVSMEDDLVQMVNNDGVNALTELLDLVTETDSGPFSGRVKPEAKSSEIIAQRIKRLKNIFIPASARVNENVLFVFEDALGVYDYNFEIQDFELVEQGGDKVQVNFPTAESTTNNATLNLTDYADLLIIDEYDGWESYYPTVLQADLSVDNETLVVLDLSANYSADGLPEKAEVSLTLLPFEFSMKFSDDVSTKSSVSYSMSKSGEKIMGSSLTVVYTSSDKEMLESLQGEVYYRSIALKGKLDVSKLDEEAEFYDINDFIDLALYDGSTKIGDIVFEDDEWETIAYIEYADGSKELLEDLLAPVIEELEDFIMELEGEA